MPEIDVKALRKGQGWTQEELARRVGVSQATAAMWDQGRQPTAYNAVRLARALGTTVEALYETSPAHE